MQLSIFKLFLLLPVLFLAGCVEGSLSPSPSPDMIVVVEFAIPEGAVVLDPSFGFSLYRGQPGVPQRQRAISVGDAVGFLVADTVTQRLREAGYEAASSTEHPQLPGRALIVSGVFRRIDEGHRRRVGAEDSSVIADVSVRATGPGGSPQPVMTLQLDSRQLPRGPVASAASRRETGVNADAARVGLAIANAVANLARHNNWTIVSR